MPRYKALTRLMISHECREVQEGEEFETTFPKINGKPMELGDNIIEIKPAKAKGAASGVGQGEGVGQGVGDLT